MGLSTAAMIQSLTSSLHSVGALTIVFIKSRVHPAERPCTSTGSCLPNVHTRGRILKVVAPRTHPVLHLTRSRILFKPPPLLHSRFLLSVLLVVQLIRGMVMLVPVWYSSWEIRSWLPQGIGKYCAKLIVVELCYWNKDKDNEVWFGMYCVYGIVV